jgi:hypothetical protein
MEDIFAQSIALAALAKASSGGGSVDAYTKAETDALLAEKADLSILTPMTQAEYDAIVTKTAPLYFIYEDGGGT